ncbi:MAG: preprotein translocase subunit SecG [Acidobacteria bacterium]|nr:preprotein translocase subunit SecG [Acidobacteriota bacterium]
MYAALIVLHCLVCLVLILVVLLQTGKGADLAGAFGGGGSQTALGSRGAATVLSKATTVAAIIFMFTSLALAIFSSRRTSAVLQSTPITLPSSPSGAPPGTPAAPAPDPGAAAPKTDSSTQPPEGGQAAPAQSSPPEQKK